IPDLQRLRSLARPVPVSAFSLEEGPVWVMNRLAIFSPARPQHPSYPPRWLGSAGAEMGRNQTHALQHDRRAGRSYILCGVTCRLLIEARTRRVAGAILLSLLLRS